MVDPSELIADTGPNVALVPAPASIVVLLGCPVTVIRTPVPAVVKLNARVLFVICSTTLKLKVVSI
mgnify:CR=1 FL=1